MRFRESPIRAIEKASRTFHGYNWYLKLHTFIKNKEF